MDERAWIVAAPGNEAPYLLEWTAHYRDLGFAGAILFTSGAEDGTEAMAARLEALGHARHVPLDPREGRDPLRRGLRGLPPLLAELGAEWVLPVDIDEFLAIRAGAGDLASLLAAVGPTDAVSVCRKPFGCGGRRGLPGGRARRLSPMRARGCARADDHPRDQDALSPRQGRACRPAPAAVRYWAGRTDMA
ncbi:MAG: glycosyltransferase family 2 protein [Roseovarius sp.]|nr:glycosyltransferase family 2 protein [Roseovarius sp.]